jgi:hypothetical protein
VFIVGYLGDWRPSAAVLFERACLSGDNQEGGWQGSIVAPPVKACPGGGDAYGFYASLGSQGGGWRKELSPTLKSGRGSIAAVAVNGRARRHTLTEYERLQGFRDGYTLIPYRGKMAADAPRYTAVGNSMPVPVMAWIGGRIAKVDAILRGAP